MGAAAMPQVQLPVFLAGAQNINAGLASVCWFVGCWGCLYAGLTRARGGPAAVFRLPMLHNGATGLVQPVRVLGQPFQFHRGKVLVPVGWRTAQRLEQAQANQHGYVVLAKAEKARRLWRVEASGQPPCGRNWISRAIVCHGSICASAGTKGQRASSEIV